MAPSKANRTFTKESRTEAGAQIIEFAAVIPILLLIVTIAMEAFTAFTIIERIEAAARAGARVAGPKGLDTAEATARASLPDWLDDATVKAGYSSGSVYTEVSTTTPVMWKNAPFEIKLTRRVEMPPL